MLVLLILYNYALSWPKKSPNFGKKVGLNEKSGQNAEFFGVEKISQQKLGNCNKKKRTKTTTDCQNRKMEKKLEKTKHLRPPPPLFAAPVEPFDVTNPTHQTTNQPNRQPRVGFKHPVKASRKVGLDWATHLCHRAGDHRFTWRLFPRSNTHHPEFQPAQPSKTHPKICRKPLKKFSGPAFSQTKD